MCKTFIQPNLIKIFCNNSSVKNNFSVTNGTLLELFSGTKETEKVWNEKFSKKLPHDIQKRALQKLRMLHVASVLDD